jgi:hypothetical protein
VHGFAEVRSRGVEAAVAASTQADHKRAWGKILSDFRRQVRVQILQKETGLNADFAQQLNFEFTRNKNSIAVFMIRLRRVYRA